jgi:hypothetical protein
VKGVLVAKLKLLSERVIQPLVTLKPQRGNGFTPTKVDVCAWPVGD